MMKAFFFSALSIVLPAVSFADESDQALADSTKNIWVVASAAQALDHALQITGFAARMDKAPAAAAASSLTEMLTITSDNTPFLADSISGRVFWQVKLDNIDIRRHTEKPWQEDPWDRRDFEVTIEPASGHVIRIQTVTRATHLWPEASASSATAQLVKAGERYWGFVDSLPEIALIEALNAVAGCTPLVAEEIIAQCVMYSRGDQEPRPAWIITTRGIPATEGTARSRQASEEIRSRGRCVVDATTGDWLTMSLRPHPDYEADIE